MSVEELTKEEVTMKEGMTVDTTREEAMIIGATIIKVTMVEDTMITVTLMEDTGINMIQISLTTNKAEVAGETSTEKTKDGVVPPEKTM